MLDWKSPDYEKPRPRKEVLGAFYIGAECGGWTFGVVEYDNGRWMHPSLIASENSPSGSPPDLWAEIEAPRINMPD